MQNLVIAVEKMFIAFSAYLPTPYKASIPLVEKDFQKRSVQLGSKRILLSLEDRIAIVGMTGSGKTTLVKQLLLRLRREYPGARVYILDSKQAGDFVDIIGTFVQTAQAPDILRLSGGCQIWQPPDDNIVEYDWWFKRILMHKKPAIVLIDEIASIISKKGEDAPEYYRKLNKLGRAFGIMLISLSQEGAYVPRTFLGQMTHVIRMRLLDGYDVAKLDRLVGRSKEEFGQDLPDQYGFIHRRVDKAIHGNYYKDWQEFIGRD